MLGAPNQPELASETRSFDAGFGERSYTILNLHTTLSSKLGAAFSRGSTNDFNDVLFLLRKSPLEISTNISPHLDAVQRQAFCDEYRRKFPGKDRELLYLKRVLRLV